MKTIVRTFAAASIAAAVCLCSFSGCTQSTTGPSPAGLALLLPTEPADAMGVVELKDQIMTTGLGGDVTIAGRVGGGQNETWDSSQSTFLLRDLELKTETHDHGGGASHADNCKFCQAEKANELLSMALVRVVDEQGSVLPGDARALLGIQEDQVVVVQGSGSIDDVGTLVFDATKVFIRK